MGSAAGAGPLAEVAAAVIFFCQDLLASDETVNVDRWTIDFVRIISRFGQLPTHPRLSWRSLGNAALKSTQCPEKNSKIERNR